MSFWIGSVIGSAAVIFVEMLIFLSIFKKVVDKKNLGIHIEVVRHALISAVIMGILANTIFTPVLMGQFVIFLIVLCLIGLLFA
jgi:uncharacterized membrane protein YvlD (DUF360 family)